ncbi:dTDP-4-dehydrorhamnose reductase [Thiomicrospira sp. WB1]|uniref:dTDP-4-dehydrorhamnose reductase n=1 Tax=Thiomicrospira sp. WB1 TaxID=1685380 RepID=UPI000748C5FC|nr:dTDP-4-dehydrorhamnose reductase [Thiomicrospira sp. WB1]KUJ72473.1 hypothetical protein AVO41_01280 [Thiomicrospira sp. WB1]
MTSTIKQFLVLGKNGQLGQSLQKVLTDQKISGVSFAFYGREAIDLSEPETVLSFLQSRQVDGIINCAAYTHVDQAEQDAELADRINHQSVHELAQFCQSQDIPLVHISTDYVFDGNQIGAYREHDLPNPINQYGTSKLKGEQAIHALSPPGCIIRTSWVHSEYGRNFIKTMQKIGLSKPQLDVVFDQVGSPTYATHLAKAILHMLQHPAFSSCQSELFHFSNEGVTSWYDLAFQIFKQPKSPNVFLSPISTDQYPTPAQRPLYTVLDSRKFCHWFDYAIPNWLEGVEECLNHLKPVTSLSTTPSSQDQ